MTFFTVLFQMLSLLIMIAAGFIVTKAGIMDDQTSSRLSTLLLNLFNPMLAISSASSAVGQIPFTRMVIVFFGALGLFLYFIIIALIFARFFDKDYFQRKMFELMFIFSNLGFIGVPVVNTVLGSEYVVYVSEFMLVYNLVFYTYGITLLDGKFSAASLKKLLTPSNLLILCSLLILAFEIRLPDFIITAAGYLGNVTSPLALMIIGYSLANSSVRQIFGNPKLYLFSLIKLLVLPVIALPAVRLLPLPSDLTPLFLIMLGMPVGNLPMLLGQERGLDCTTCSSGIIMTTLFCLVTIPILMMLV